MIIKKQLAVTALSQWFSLLLFFWLFLLSFSVFAGCINTSSTAPNLTNTGFVSGQPAGSYHPNAYNFTDGASLFAAGFCVEKSDGSPQINDTYSPHSTPRQSFSASTIDYLARLYAGLQDADVFALISAEFAGDEQRMLDNIFQYLTWYYTDWGQDYFYVQDMIDYRAISNGFTAGQKTAFENATMLALNRSKGINGETQYSPTTLSWLYNETSTGRQDIAVPESYIYGSNCSTPATPAYCPAPTIETNFADFRIAWMYNAPTSTLLPDHQPWSNQQYDQNVIANAPAQSIGFGLNHTFDADKLNVIHLSQVNEATLNTAQSAGDYIEYQFTTQASMNQAQLFNGLAFASNTYVQSYDIGIVLSEDNFATSHTLLANYTVQPTAAYEFKEIPTDQPFYLKPNTSYKFRVIFYNASNANTVYWDDFHISMGLCQDYSDAPPSSYGIASHNQPRTTQHYLGNAQADAEKTVRDGGDAGDNADGDDSAGSTPDDEDALTTIPDLYTNDTSYTLNVSCTGSGIVAGWIDFSGDSSFNSTERNNNHPVSCNNNTATLTWTALSGLSAGKSYIRLRTASTQSDVDNPTGAATDGEVEDYTFSIQTTPSCDAATGAINSGLSPTAQLVDGHKIWLASTDISPTEGHLKAYALNSEGAISDMNTPLWDAATQMNKAERLSALFSTNAVGDKTLFTALDDAAFVATASPTIATIKSYTLEPSYNNPQYIADRKANSFLGRISPHTTLALLDNSIDTLRFMDDVVYRNFYNNTISLRADTASATKPKRVLMSSDDGFLYAFNQYDGALGWGWMPRSLIQHLKDYATFQDKHLMQGNIDVLDLKDTYVDIFTLPKGRGFLSTAFHARKGWF